MGITVGQTYPFDLAGRASDNSAYGSKICIVGLTLDNSYLTGGEAILPSDFGMNGILAVQILPQGTDYDFVWDAANGKIKALVKGVGAPSIGIIKDDNSAETNGTDVVAAPPLNQLPAFLNSVNANNADATFDVGAGGPQLIIDDNNAPVGVAIYFDEDAVIEERLLCVVADNRDLYIPLDNGEYIRIVDDNDAATKGVAVHFDDNGGTVSERLLFISPTNVDGTFQTYNEAPAGTDLSAVVLQVIVWGT